MPRGRALRPAERNVLSYGIDRSEVRRLVRARRRAAVNRRDIVTSTYRAGNDVVVVVSAQGDTTDDLIAKAKEINKKPSKREMDQLLTAGEQISASLLAMAIEQLGYPVVSLLGWQAGFSTSRRTAARASSA